MKIEEYFLQIMLEYKQARNDNELASKIRTSFKYISDDFKDLIEEHFNSDLFVKYSIGQGAMANVPWIAVEHEFFKKNKSTQKAYVGLLFKADMSGFYLTLILDYGLKSGNNPTQDEIQVIYQKNLKYRKHFQFLSVHNFQLNDFINLADKGKKGQAYEKATIAYKYYPQNKMPSNEELFEDFKVITNGYLFYIKSIN